MNEHKEPIPSMIYNASIGGHVTNSQQIIDENENKEQSQINAEVKQTLGQGGSVDSRISKAKNDIIGDASSNGNTLQKIENRISPLESAIGSGGSIDSRIAAAKSEIKGNVTSACDTLGKAETKINTNTVAINTNTVAISTESSRAKTAEEQLRTLYNNLQQSQPIPVTELPAIGEAGKIYRLAGSTSYADYMYAADALTIPIKMAEYNNAIDDKPTAGSENLVKSGSVWNTAKEIDGLENLFDESVKGYITTGVGVGNTVDINTISSQNDYYHTIIQCKQDEVFIIKGKGGSAPRLWCFTDDNYKVVSVADINKDTSANPEEIVAPSDGYLIINSNYNQTIIKRYRYVEKKEFNIIKEKTEVAYEKVNEIYDIIEFDNKNHYYKYENNALKSVSNKECDCTLINVSDFRDNKITMIADVPSYTSSLKSIMFFDKDDNLISDIPLLGALNYRIDIPENATKIVLNASKTINAKFFWGYRRNVKRIKYTEILKCPANTIWNKNVNNIRIIDARNIKITKSNTIISNIYFGYNGGEAKGLKINGLTSSIRKSYNDAIQYGAYNRTDNDITDTVTIEIDNDAPEDMLITNPRNFIGEDDIATGKHLIWGVIGISENVTFDMADIEFFDMESKIVNNSHTISGVLANNYIDPENWGDTYNDAFALEIANIKVSRDIVLNNTLLITTNRDIDFCDHSVTIKKNDNINTQYTPLRNAAVLLNQYRYHLYQRIKNLTINCNYYYYLGLWFGYGRQVLFENIKIYDCIFAGFCAGIPNTYIEKLDLSSHIINGKPGPNHTNTDYFGSIVVNKVFCINNRIDGMIRTGYDVFHVIPNSHGFYLTSADSMYYNIGCQNFQCGTRGGDIIFNFHPWVDGDEWLFVNDGTEENPHYPVQDICGIELRYTLGNRISLYYPQFDGSYNPIKLYLQNDGIVPDITINDGIWYMSDNLNDMHDTLGLDFNFISIIEPKETSYVPFNAHILRGSIKNNKDNERLHLCDNSNFPNAVADFKMVKTDSYVKVALSGTVIVPSDVIMPKSFVLHMVNNETGKNDIKVQISDGQYSTNVVLGESYTIVCDGFTSDVEYINIKEPTVDYVISLNK